MKKAYDVRSKYLHGSEIAIKTKDPNYYTDLSVRVDQFARIILKRIITVYKDNFIIQHAKIFESYFEYLVSNPSGAEND
jgi:hypothetical protein